MTRRGREIERQPGILGLAVAYPEAIVDGTALGMTAEDQRATGFRRVHVARDAAETVDLLCEAARSALADAGAAPASLDALVVMRNGHDPRHASAWLSLLVAGRLGIRPAACLDLKSAGCAGLVHGIEVAAALFAGRSATRALVLGGGASGLTTRWFPDPDLPARPRSGILSGDGAYGVVLGPDEAPIRVLGWQVLLDPEFANLVRFVDGTYVQDDDEFARWLGLAATWSSRAMLDAMRAAGTLGRPHILFGSNTRIKVELFGKLAGDAAGPRGRRMLELQLDDMARVGHVLGGDAASNLAALRRAGVLASGDHLLCLEIGDAYFYSVAVLRVELG